MSLYWKPPFGVLFFFLLASCGYGWNFLALRASSDESSVEFQHVKLIPRPELVSATSLGFEDVIADFYWAAAIHYYADPANAAVQYAQLSQYIDLVNALAPQWDTPYRFGGIGIPFRTPNGKYVNLDGAERVLRRGIRQFPHSWFLKMLLSFTLSTYQHRYADAANVIADAAEDPGAPAWYGSLAIRLKTRANDVDGAMELARAFQTGSPDPSVQLAMEARLKELELLKEMRFLQRQVESFFRATHRWPTSFRELESEGYVPADPPGGFTLDTTTGRVDVQGFDPHSLMPFTAKE